MILFEKICFFIARRIKANKPGITIKDKKEKKCKLIDMKVPVGKKVS